MDPLNGTGGHAHSMPAYHRTRGILGGLEKIMLTIAAMMILIMSLYVSLGIGLRTFFHGKLYDEVVIIGEMMVMSISLSFAFVAADRGYVAVEIFTSRAGPRVRIFLDILASLIGLVALVPITISAWKAFVRVWNEGSYFFGVLNLPEWPGNFVYIIGIAVFMLRLIDLLIHDSLLALGILGKDIRSESVED